MKYVEDWPSLWDISKMDRNQREFKSDPRSCCLGIPRNQRLRNEGDFEHQQKWRFPLSHGATPMTKRKPPNGGYLAKTFPKIFGGSQEWWLPWIFYRLWYSHLWSFGCIVENKKIYFFVSWSNLNPMRFVIQIFVVFFIGMDHTFKQFEMISPWK